MPPLRGAAAGLRGARGPSERVRGGRGHRSSQEMFGIGSGEGVSGEGLSPVLPQHSPCPSTSPAGVPAPRAPVPGAPGSTTGPAPLDQTGTIGGDGALGGGRGRAALQVAPVGAQGRDRSAGLGLTPPKCWWGSRLPSHPPATPFSAGADPCLPWPHWGEQGRGTRGASGCWLGGAGLDPTLWGLNGGLGRALSPAVCPGQRPPPIWGPQGGGPVQSWQKGWDGWGKGDQRAAAGSSRQQRAATREGLRHAAARREPISPQQGPLSAANTRSGPRGDLQPFPSTYPTALPLRPTSMPPQRCRNNRLTKSYF